MPEVIRFNEGRTVFFPNSEGVLKIWEHPIEDEEYYIGVDPAGGIEGGDPSAIEIIKGDDCAQVAELRGWIQPGDLGRHAARLASYYNNAMIAVETFPTAYGLPCHEAAVEWGHRNMYTKRRFEVVGGDFTERKGWTTDPRSMGLMTTAVHNALFHEYIIRSEVLLGEFLNLREPEGKAEKKAGEAPQKPICRGHDDCHDAYAIALCVRHEQYRKLRIQDKPRAPEPTDLQERFHAHRRKQREAGTLYSLNPKRRASDGY